MDESFRARFQNAADYAALYPRQRAPSLCCLPRLEDGLALEAILGRLRRRAGLSKPAMPGPLRGFVDRVDAAGCVGWALDDSAPGDAVYLEILSGARLLGRVMANAYRADVAAAGFGTGHHGFHFKLPPGARGPFTIRRAADCRPLPYAAVAA